MSKYGVISGPYFPEFSPNTGKYGPEITQYLGTFHAVSHKKTITLHASFFSEYQHENIVSSMVYRSALLSSGEVELKLMPKHNSGNAI